MPLTATTVYRQRVTRKRAARAEVIETRKRRYADPERQELHELNVALTDCLEDYSAGGVLAWVMTLERIWEQLQPIRLCLATAQEAAWRALAGFVAKEYAEAFEKHPDVLEGHTRVYSIDEANVNVRTA